MASKQYQVDWEDIVKGLRAFSWNFLSLLIAVTGFLITLPKEQVPVWMWGILASAPLINGLGVVILQWLQGKK